MHFCDSYHEITRKQQEENNNIKDHKLISCWWEYKNIRSFSFHSLMIVFWYVASQKIGKKTPGSSSQPALLVVTYHSNTLAVVWCEAVCECLRDDRAVDFPIRTNPLFENDIRIRSECCFGWNLTIRIRKLSTNFYLKMHSTCFKQCLFCLIRKLHCWIYLAFSWIWLVEVVTWHDRNAWTA